MKSPLNNITRRERVMLVALLVVGAMIWGSYFMKRWDSVHAQLSEARKETENQRLWLRSLPQFEAKRNAVLGQMDKSKTFNASQLVGWFDNIARTLKLRHTLSAPTVTADSIFTRNTLSVNLRNVNLEQLLSIERQIRELHPYLSLDEMTIVANPADQRLLNIRLTLSSFEIK